jgi:hypothetical protein
MDNAADINKPAQVDLAKVVPELENLKRIVGNTYQLVQDAAISGSDAKAVAEIMSWLEEFHTRIKSQLDSLQPPVPTNPNV